MGSPHSPKGPESILYKHMLHIKSKIMKSKMQWCKNFAQWVGWGGGGGKDLGACLGVTRGQKVGFSVLFFDCHTTPLRLFELEPRNRHR